MSKKILFVIGNGVYPRKVGGMEIFNYYLLKNIREKINVFSFSVEKYNFCNVGYIKSFPIRPAKFLFPFQLFICLLFHKFDKIVYSYSSAHWVIWWLFEKIALLFKIPYVIVIHYGEKPHNDHINIFQHFFSSAKYVIAVSTDIKRNYDSKYNIHCKIIPPLVPFEKSIINKKSLREKYNIPFNASAICMVGSIKKMKNPDTIIDAINMMNKKEIEKYNPHIVYAGLGEMTDILKDKAKKYGLEDRIHFLGFVPKEKVCEVMNLSNLYLIASDFEGTSVSLLEAMYNGMPIIASLSSGIIDTITPNESLMFPTRDAFALKEAVITLLSNKQLSKQLSDSAKRKYHDLYNYDNIIKKYLSILNS